MKVYYSSFQWENWTFYLGATEKGLCYADIRNPRESKKFKNVDLIDNAEFITPFKNQYLEYFDKKRDHFTFQIDIKGTPFQEAVWKSLIQIPLGESRFYQEIASAIQNPKAIRAVGGAIGNNPLLIAIPCHRVIGKNRTLTGFSSGLDLKKRLLEIENISYIE